MKGFITPYRITYKCVKRYPDRSVVELQVRICPNGTEFCKSNVLSQWTGLLFHKPIVAGLESLGIRVFETRSNHYAVIIPRNTDERELTSHEMAGDPYQSATHIIYHMLPPPGFPSEEVMEVSLV